MVFSQILLRTVILLSTHCFLMFGSVGHISAQEPVSRQSKMLDLILDRDIVTRICEILDLSEAQIQFAWSEYEVYDQKIAGVEKDALTFWEDTTKAIQVNEEETVLAESEKLQRDIDLRMSALKRRLRALRQADSLLAEWINSFSAILADDQLDRIPEVWRLVRRLNFRRPDSRFNFDFQIHIDVISMLEQAIDDEGEFHEFYNDTDPTVFDSYRAFRREIDACRDQYELLLDAALLGSLARRRRPPSDELLGTTNVTHPKEWERYLAKIGRIWHSEHRVSMLAVECIALHVQKIDAHSAKTWRLRIWKAYAPNAMRMLHLESASAWMAGQSDATSDDLESAQAFLSEFEAKVHRFRRRIMKAGALAERIHGFPVGLESEQLDYVRLLLDLRDYHDAALDRFGRALFTRALRTRYLDWVDQARRQSSKGFEFAISVAILKFLDRFDSYRIYIPPERDSPPQ